MTPRPRYHIEKLRRLLRRRLLLPNAADRAALHRLEKLEAIAARVNKELGLPAATIARVDIDPAAELVVETIEDAGRG